MNIEVDTAQLDRLVRDFDMAGPKVEKASSESLTRIARELRDDARASAPVRTGKLKSSIRVQGGKDWRLVKSDLRYSAFVEFGTSDTPPQPYLWPHARKAQQSLIEAMERDSDPL